MLYYLSLKISSWNIKHASKMLKDNPSNTVQERILRVYSTIKDIDPDILCIQEGPRGEQDIDRFCSIVLKDEWLPILLKEQNDQLGDRDKEYRIKGNQWIWFLTRPELSDKCRLQSPNVWQSFIGRDEWPVNYWGQESVKDHSHYRHPQVMIYKIDAEHEIEFIGVHLKSKINMLSITRDSDGNLTGDYLAEATEARIKLATEARNIREYISSKFEQVVYPGLVLMGDCNDGPGNDFFETQYLFFDLISNLQGDVMISERFFNHGLFDFAGHLRWTAKFRDGVSGISAGNNPLLIDHILISQSLCRGEFPLVVNEFAGKVEHEVFERNNAGATANAKTSDHRPISLKFDSKMDE